MAERHGGLVSKSRLEAFSDGVIAIIITIMVLELRPPQGIDLHALREMGPDLCAYVLSFVLLGIYWNNHHLLVGAMRRVTGAVLWANLHLLFWLSLVPFATAWMGRNPHAPFPIAIYGGIAFLAAVAYTILQMTIIAADGHGSRLAQAVGNDMKGRMSLASYALAILFAFVYYPMSYALYVLVALIWLVPDSRIAHHSGE
jgi:TMEM175 potassium channel family protein